MKILTSLLTITALASVAQAQTIGGVTLSKPAPHNYRPAPVRTTVTTSTVTTTSNSTIAVPNGWYQLQGNITARQTMRLPAGSTVHVYLEDVTKPRQMLHINFNTSRLPTNYQMVFNPSRLNTAHQYTLRSTVVDAQGKQLYSSAPVLVSQGQHNVNLSVKPTRQ